MKANFQEFVFQRSKELKLTRTELARRARVSRESLYKILRGEIANPSIETLHGLAVALEVAPMFLLREYFDGLNLGPGTLLTVCHESDHVSFVQDVTVPDGFIVGVNQTFTKVWEVQNTGKVLWHGRKLVCQDGQGVIMARRLPDGTLEEVVDSYLAPAVRAVPVPDTPPGGTVQLSVDFTAPAFPGTVMSVWKMVDKDGTICFPNFTGVWCSVRVVAL